MLITEEYRRLNQELHELGSYGRKGDKWKERVTDLIERFEPARVLDYGCGQGALGRSLDRSISEYDPAIAGKNGMPEPANLVICTDVLEHIEPDLLDSVLDHLQSLTLRHLFVVICTREAKKLLPDGRNAHLIVEPWPFWKERLERRFQIVECVPHGKEVEVLLAASSGQSQRCS